MTQSSGENSNEIISEILIPKFPQFRVVEFSDKATIEELLRIYPPYSDFNFTSLWAWDIKKQRMISELNGNLVVRFTDYSSDEPFLSFLGKFKPTETARTILAYCKVNDLPSSLRLIPHTSINGMEADELIIEEDRNNFDYMYLISDLCTLHGRRFQTKRYMGNKFRREYPTAHVRILDISSKTTQLDIIGVISKWETNKLKKRLEYELDHELIAIKRLLETATNNMYLVAGVISDGVLLGFAITEVLAVECSVLHFWKCDVLHLGVYDFLMNEAAKLLELRGVKYLNFEQDLGVENLRRTKTSYRPSHFLKKYIVSLPTA